MSVVSVVAAYLLGAVPFAQIVARRQRGVDLREVGTGTVSGTGLFRVAGFGLLVVGGGLDVIKGVAAAFLATDNAWSAPLVAGAVVTGHCWSLFLRGAGGRGLSPGMGAMLVLAWPGTAVLAVALAVGRLVRQTGLAVFLGALALVPVLAVTRGSGGAAIGAAVVVPMLVKRVLGNTGLVRGGGPRLYASRLLLDADPHG